MGLLDQVIGGVLGNVLGGGRGNGQPQGGGGQGGLGGSLSPIVQALLMLLLQKGAGGLGDILGGGRGAPSDPDQDEADRGRRGPPPEPYGEDEGDRGGFNQDRGPRGQDAGSRGSSPEGDFSDLSGMLDGPGDNQGASAGAGPYSRLDHEQGEDLGGLDGLIDRFQRGGLGDAINSWIGHGQNQPVEPQRLADALGSDTVNTLQSRTGLSRDELLSQLAQALPGVIDGLTPQGRRPDAQERRHW